MSKSLFIENNRQKKTSIFFIDFSHVPRKIIIRIFFFTFADAFLFFLKTCTAKMAIYQGYNLLLGSFLKSHLKTQKPCIFFLIHEYQGTQATSNLLIS